MPETSKVETLGTYEIWGDTLFLSAPPREHRYCIGDSLRREIRAGVDTLGFWIQGDSLTLFLDRQFTDAGARIQNSRRLIRVSGTPGALPGTWMEVEPGYRILSGTPTPAESTALQSGLEKTRREMAFQSVTWNFSADSVTRNEDVRWAQLFLARWNGIIDGGPAFADSSVFDIGVKVTSKLTVEFSGRRTGEAIRLTEWPNGDRTYRSGEPSHAEFRYFSSPTGCPAPFEPVWYADFLAANRKIVNILAL